MAADREAGDAKAGRTHPTRCTQGSLAETGGAVGERYDAGRGACTADGGREGYGLTRYGRIDGRHHRRAGARLVDGLGDGGGSAGTEVGIATVARCDGMRAGCQRGGAEG